MTSLQEERFLFPVYPMICLTGAISVDVLQKLYFFIRTKFCPLHIGCHYSQYTAHIMIVVFIVYGLFGFSRTLALYKGMVSKGNENIKIHKIWSINNIILCFITGYYAPMEIMIETNKLGSEGGILSDGNINFCVGKEWHRFPNSFFFPSNK